jgi:hypothetical protein
MRVDEPSPDEEDLARLHPNGYVYRLAGYFGPQDAVPPEAIIGAWRVDASGRIAGAFIKNDSYDPRRWPPRER